MFGTVCKEFIIFIPRLRLCLGQCVNNLLFDFKSFKQKKLTPLGLYLDLPTLGRRKQFTIYSLKGHYPRSRRLCRHANSQISS